MQAFISTLLSDDAYDNLMFYLEQVVKPRDFTAHALANRLRVLNVYSVALPTNTGAPAKLLTDDTLKAIYFRMMPIDWQISFRQAGKCIVTYTLASLSEYMQTLASLDLFLSRNTTTILPTAIQDIKAMAMAMAMAMVVIIVVVVEVIAPVATIMIALYPVMLEVTHLPIQQLSVLKDAWTMMQHVQYMEDINGALVSSILEAIVIAHTIIAARQWP